jgi:hypothetical protein
MTQDERERLGRAAYKAWQDWAADFRPHFAREEFDGLELVSRENWCGIAEAVAAAVAPPAPAAAEESRRIREHLGRVGQPRGILDATSVTLLGYAADLIDELVSLVPPGGK